MPYIDGKYVLSIYEKESLPTWNEIWNEFFLNEAFDYDPSNPNHNIEGKLPDSKPETILSHIDMYWKRPHRKMLLGWMCNQFNKMMYEDGLFDKTVTMVKDKLNSTQEISDIRFFLHRVDSDFNFELCVIPPPVVTCKLPSTDERSMFASEHPAVYIDDYDGHIELVIVISGPDNSEVRFITKDKPEYSEIIRYILHDVELYYSGDKPGWKDGEGNNVITENPKHRGCTESGVDPAI